MPVIVDYKFRPGTDSLSEQPSSELEFIVQGTTDRTTAHALMLAFAPSVWQGLVPQSSDITFISDAMEGFFEGQVRYGLYKPPEAGDSEFSFEIGGATQKITTSISTVQSKAPPGLTAPDFKGAIGVTKDGVEGVDIPAPSYKWTEKHYFKPGFVTPQYKQALYEVSMAPVNAFAWRGFQGGEVLFEGASGSGKQKELIEITFKFAASKNYTGLTKGDITGINKKGWEYLWFRFADQEDTAAKALVKRPIAAYVEQIFFTSDFTQLQIGT